MTKAHSIAEQVGQLMIVGFDGTAMSSGLRSLLTRVRPAGVILFARNIIGGEQTHELLKECRAIVSTPLFACVDMEGGRVDRFRDVTGSAPSAADVFATGDRKAFRKHGRIIGDSCRALGFNTNFAPVVDLAFEASRNVMSSRAVSDDPKQAAIYAREFLAGLRSAGVLGAIKHFPGLGEANLDTHHDLPSVVGHAAYPAVTHDHDPASLSKKWITDILRRKIGYRGLVVSDDLEMGGVLEAAPIERAAVEHIRAGGDLCLICHIEEHITRSYDALVKETERDAKFARRVKQSVARVLAFKRRSKELKRPAPAPTSAKLEKLSRQLWEFSEQVRLAAIRRQDQA
jgi:beta-N-acetylhexosaminidase